MMNSAWTTLRFTALVLGPLIGCGTNNDPAKHSSTSVVAPPLQRVTHNENRETVAAETRVAALSLEQRTGTAPTVRNSVPHQQRDQNSPPDVLHDLASFLFGLEHVEEKTSRGSFPSARGAFIKAGVEMNVAIRREFTHIHMEPGPGSQHLVLTENDFLSAIEKGWGLKHPWSERMAKQGLVLMMVYAPRDQTDLREIKKIITAAWELALVSD